MISMIHFDRFLPIYIYIYIEQASTNPKILVGREVRKIK